MIKPFILISCLLFVVLSCGSDSDEWAILSYVEGWPVCSDLTQDDLEVITKVVHSFDQTCSLPQYSSLKRFLPPSDCLLVIRHLQQRIPPICKRVIFGYGIRCARTWGGLPDIVGIPPSDPAIGYRGINTEGFVMVANFGPHRERFWHVSIHEYAHTLGFHHGDKMRAFEKLVRKAYKQED